MDFLKEFYNSISIIDLIYLILTILSLIKCYKKGFILSSYESVVGRVGSPCSIKLITWLYSSFKSLLFGSASSANKRLEFVYSCPQ